MCFDQPAALQVTYVWHLAPKIINRRMHALHGNCAVARRVSRHLPHAGKIVIFDLI